MLVPSIGCWDVILFEVFMKRAYWVAVLACVLSFLALWNGITFSQASEVKSSYELFYPIVAGKVPGDRFYSLKILREKIVGMFLFDTDKKIEYRVSLSKKRLVEAEKLIKIKKDYSLAVKTLESSVEEAKTAWNVVKDKNNGPKDDTLVEAGFMASLANDVPSEDRQGVVTLSEKMRSLTTR